MKKNFQKFLAVIIVIALFAVIASLTGYEKTPADAYLKEPYHALPENIYYDTIIYELDTIKLTDKDAIWIAVVKPYYGSGAVVPIVGEAPDDSLLGNPVVLITHMKLRGDKYKYDSGFATLFYLGSEIQSEEDANAGVTANSLSVGGTVHYCICQEGQTIDPRLDAAQQRKYRFSIEGREYKLCFYYYVD